MAAELQHLIEKLQSEAISKANAQAQDIVSQAKDKAAGLVQGAEQQAAQVVAQAKIDAQQFTERSVRTLEQAARDLLISVGQGVEKLLEELVSESLDEAMSIDVVKNMLTSMAETYTARADKERRMEILVSPEAQEELIKFYAGRYRDALGEGIEIKPSRSISKGFRVSFKDEHAHHDFTKEAIAEALSRFLRPHLSDIILRVAREDREKSK
jgi:V/A-type H+-transporting ATPase subunit E